MTFGLRSDMLGDCVLWLQSAFVLQEEFEDTKRGHQNTAFCEKVCQWLATGRWFSLGTPVSSINKTDLHDITEILLKVALNTITLIPITPLVSSHFSV